MATCKYCGRTLRWCIGVYRPEPCNCEAKKKAEAEAKAEVVRQREELVVKQANCCHEFEVRIQDMGTYLCCTKCGAVR